MMQAVAAADVGAFDRAADVVIVGYGIAGACAALEARAMGKEVLIIERASGGGGTSATSEGIFYLGGGTSMQRDCGYQDDADELFKFLSASTGGEPEKLRAFADGSAAHFDWLEDNGVPFSRTAFDGKAVSIMDEDGGLLTTGNEKVWPYRDIAKPAPRGHQAKRTADRSSGSLAMEGLMQACERAGVSTLYDAQVTALITDADRVSGVKIRCSDRDTHVQARQAVILATGSFNSNPEMVSRNCPQVSETAIPIGIPYNDGSGIMMGQSVGGDVKGMNGIIATASLYPPADLIKGIVVNRNGERFVAEDAYHGRLADFISEQPDQTAYLIVDNEIFSYPQNHSFIDGWETVPEMEAALDLPAGSLVKTVNDYNEDARSHVDTAFNKYKDWLRPLDKAPYAAFDISFNKSRYAFLTLGGLHTNLNGEVLDSGGMPITGLLAAGACAAQLPQNGKEYASGLTLGPGSFFARLAGKYAAGLSADQ